MNFYDAHNHLQDDRIAGRQAALLAVCAKAGIARMVVNGTRESNWLQVLALARQYGGGASVPASRAGQTKIIPSFGYHPWYLAERTPDWLNNLTEFLDAVPSAIGEIGLDRWKPNLPYVGQEEAFLAQLSIATERNVPVSMHCLHTWGRMLELLQKNPRPPCGWVLHSYGGPAEMIPALAKLGAYFSFPGYFLHERKLRQREAFRHVPADRLLIETDAPDQHLPEEKTLHPLAGTDGKALNHPANLPVVYAGLAGILGESVESLAGRVEENFQRVFGGI